jgi:hypothetical protein
LSWLQLPQTMTELTLFEAIVWAATLDAASLDDQRLQKSRRLDLVHNARLAEADPVRWALLQSPQAAAAHITGELRAGRVTIEGTRRSTGKREVIPRIESKSWELRTDGVFYCNDTPQTEWSHISIRRNDVLRLFPAAEAMADLTPAVEGLPTNAPGEAQLTETPMGGSSASAVSQVEKEVAKATQEQYEGTAPSVFPEWLSAVEELAQRLREVKGLGAKSELKAAFRRRFQCRHTDADLLWLRFPKDVRMRPRRPTQDDCAACARGKPVIETWGVKNN